METKALSGRMEALLFLYDWHTSFFSSAIEGIDENDIHNRLNTKANHIAWLTGSLVEQRFGIAREYGQAIEQKAHELFKDNKSIQDDMQYPSLSEYKKDWDKVSPIARRAIVEVTDSMLDGEVDMGGMKMKLFDEIAFTIYREANCIGQIALWRRLLGYEGMKYM